MKFTTIYLGENKIEVFNSFLGKETVKINDEIVTNKFSLFGTEHNFKITENEELVECKLDIGYGINGAIFSLYKNKQPIIVSNKNGGGIFIVVILILSVFTGLNVFL